MFQMYQYFTIYRWYLLLKFEHFSWISCTTLFITRKNCFRYLKLMSPLNAAICTTISYTLRRCQIMYHSPWQDYLSQLQDLSLLVCLQVRYLFDKKKKCSCIFLYVSVEKDLQNFNIKSLEIFSFSLNIWGSFN
jgi:hypothetical protein